MEDNNEEVVVNDVPETSENLEEVVVNASQDETNQVPNTEDDIEKRIEEEVNKRFEAKVEERLIRDRKSRERNQAQEMASYKQLANVIQAGLGVDNIDDAIKKSFEYYKEQGVEIPEFKGSFSERDEKILARADAEEIIDLGYDEMVAEANRIANIPPEQRTIRENTVFNTLGEKLTEVQQTKQLEEKGINPEILNDKTFMKFKEQFNYKTPILDIYEMYSKLNTKPVEKPASAGSAKNETNNSVQTFSAEQINKMKPDELVKYWNNPEFRRVAGLD